MTDAHEQPTPRQRPIGEERYQVTVIGGGMAGVSAAMAAARQGMSTVLLQDRPMLGGNASGEIGVILQGADEMGRYRHSRETGLIDELFTRNVSMPNPLQSASLWSLVLWEACRQQDNLAVYLNTVAKNPVMDGNRIVSVRAEQNTTERDLQVHADLFIDCSGDGRIGYEAGAAFMFGRESRDAYREPLAIDTTDRQTMGNTIYIKARDMGRPVPFVAPTWVHRIESDEQLPGAGVHAAHHIRHLTTPNGGWWWMEFGGTLNTIDNAEDIRDELVRYAMGMWDHLKNHGDHGAANHVLESVGFVPGKRESRRFVGDHVLTQNDVESLRRFEDVVAYTQWHVDVHNPAGVSSPDSYWVGALLKGRADIPLRCLYSRNIGNLLFAGRNISATHVAMGTTRVMATCAVMGQAVGNAAALCVKHHATPRQIGQHHIVELQQNLLRQDCYLPLVANQDDDDLARSATVSSSSQAALQFPLPQTFPTLDTDTAQAFIVSEDRLHAVTLPLENRTDQPLDVTLHLRRGRWVDDFASEQDITVTTTSAPPGRSDVRFDFGDQPVEPNRPYWVMLERNPQLAWGFACDEPPCTNAAWVIDQIYGDPPAYRLFKRERGTHCLTLAPPSECFGPEQIITGVSRPERSANLWISGPGLPQWLDLTWPQPIDCDELHLTFDNNLDRQRCFWSAIGKSPELVRHYRVWHEAEGQLRLLLDVEDNDLRKRVHRFDAVRTARLRVEALATWGEPPTDGADTPPADIVMKGIAAAARDNVDSACNQVRVYEVRVYHQPSHRLATGQTPGQAGDGR